MRDAATQAQIDAAAPGESTWLSANAGSGKTRVLTDRVARLLLDGVDPQNILCLTYTKAAASEMQNRLFKRLGAWAMMPDPALRAGLAELGVDGTIDPQRLNVARTLFALAIETPGGLKIQTIHSFCAGLLRRFPLEAAVSPQFTEMENRAAELLRVEVVEEIARGPDARLVDGIARYLSDVNLARFTAAIASKGDLFLTMPERGVLATVFGLSGNATRAQAFDMAIGGDEAGLVADIVAGFADQSATYQKFAAELATVDLQSPQQSDLDKLFGLFLYATDKTSKSRNFPQRNHGKAVEAAASFIDDLHGWMDRTEAAYHHLLALAALERTTTLYAFATRFVPAYRARKALSAKVDFDDLIGKARALLSDPRVADWVLYKLDGGIDHILVDEAQDTSPAQWDVVRLLAGEFAAGEGAQPDRKRTIFVVGDKKQSIYSFQGADPEGFDRMYGHFSGELGRVATELFDRKLEYSFRSAAEILRVVDMTFTGEKADGLEKAVFHRAFKKNMPGRVDLWPVIPKTEAAKPGPDDWWQPLDQVGEQHHSVLLAHRIATEIQRMIAQETIPVEDGTTGTYQRRPITPGDFLILVRGRKSGLFSEIIRACKKADLAIAGADVLKIGDELAVRDIAALLRFLALPEDDLSLACALRSPLFNWSEQQIFTLAHRRPDKAYLWQSLRDQTDLHGPTLAILNDLRGQADFLRPYDLIARILTRHGGRKALLARLGDEAEDGIDALLAQALVYEAGEVPSLTGFLEWLDSDEVTVKRQMDAAGDRIRVMTVHGAKGLEAPIVILPDTAKPREDVRDELLPAGDHLIWKPTKPEMPPAVLEIREQMLARDARERRRLLYVAMTRAEKWLIVAAAGDVGETDQSAYGMVEQGVEAAGAVTVTLPFGPVRRVAERDFERLALIIPPEPPVQIVNVPVFGTVTPWGPADRTIAPTALGGDKVLPGDATGGEADAAKARGSMLHSLMEHLPLWPVADRPRIGQALIDAAPDDLGDTTGLLDDALRLLVAPHLAHLFGPNTLAEVDISATLSEIGGARLHGSIDRLIIAPDRILAIDFKSNRLVPATAAQTPEGILRQMGAYRAALAQIYGDRTVEVAILWTATAELMPLAASLTQTALGRVTMP